MVQRTLRLRKSRTQSLWNRQEHHEGIYGLCGSYKPL